MSEAEFVSIEVADQIATIRVDRPKMNALSRQVQEELRSAAQTVGSDSDVRAVIVWGGERVFAAGADIKEMHHWSYTDCVDQSAQLESAFTEIARIPKPTIAAITGYALGAGLELALSCDFRIVADNAKLGMPEVTLGLIPGAGGTQRLPRLVGPAKAKELIFGGEHVDAATALEIGLADAVVPAAEVLDASRVRAARYTKLAPYALRSAKEAIDRGLETDLDSGLEIERLHFAGLFATQDRTIGMDSFVEKGPGKADFIGK